MSTLAASGHRVLFVENTGVRPPRLGDLPRVRQRLRNWWRGTKGFREERPNLFVYSPLVLPLPYFAHRALDQPLVLMRAHHAAGCARSASTRPIVWTFLPTPLARDRDRALDPALTIYYCIDDLASSSPRRAADRRERAAAVQAADLVFVTSEKLRAARGAVQRSRPPVPVRRQLRGVRRGPRRRRRRRPPISRAAAADRRLCRRPAPVGRSGADRRGRRADARRDVRAGRTASRSTCRG